MADPKKDEDEGLFDKVKDFLERPLWGTGKREDEPEDAAPVTPASPSGTARSSGSSGTASPPPAAKPSSPPARPVPVQPKGATASPPVRPKAATPPPAQAGPTVGPPVPPASGRAAGSVGQAPAPEAVQAPAPAAAAPVPAPVQEAAPVPAPAPEAAPPRQTGLRVGGIAYVRQTGGMPLRMRSAPRITPDNIVSRLPMGTRLTLLEGPQAADGYDWWSVRTPNGHTGWVAGSELVTED